MDGSKKELERILSTLTENKEYLEVLNIFMQDRRVSQEDIKLVDLELTTMHNSPIKASILEEALSLTLENKLQFKELNFDTEFYTYAKMITQRITNEHFFMHHIKKQVKTLSENSKAYHTSSA